MADVNLIVDGKKVTAPRLAANRACKSVALKCPLFATTPALVAGRLPHVRREDREDAQTADRLHDGGNRGHDRRDRQR